MSKVLVDRELLVRLENAYMEGMSIYGECEEIRAVLAQPAEAEGVDFGFDDRSVKVSQEAYSIFLARERHHLAALSAVTAERDRLRAELARAYANYNQVSYASTERGKQIDQLRAEGEALRKDAERWRKCKAMPKAWWLEAMAEAGRKGGRSLDESTDAAMAAKEA